MLHTCMPGLRWQNIGLGIWIIILNIYKGFWLINAETDTIIFTDLPAIFILSMYSMDQGQAKISKEIGSYRVYIREL